MTNDSPIWTPARHPLARMLREIAAGGHRPADGGWTRVSPWSQSVQGILAVPGHAILAISYDVSDATLTDLGVDGNGGALNPRVLAHLATAAGWIDTLDVLLVTAGRGRGDTASHLVARHDLVRHPFVEAARRTKQDIQVMGRPDAHDGDVVVLSRGIAGVREVGVEVAREHRGRGLGRELLGLALDAVPEHELVALSVPAGNAAALRTAATVGAVPVGAVQVFSNRPERRA